MTFGQKMRVSLTAVGALTLTAASFATGPLGIWMLTDGNDSRDAIIHGSTVTIYNQAPLAQAQFAIQFDPTTDLFETVGLQPGKLGGVYRTDHSLVGYMTNNSIYTGDYTDGTLDTKDHVSYAVNLSTASVIQYNDGTLNQANLPIFSFGSNDVLFSITYNPVRDTLFLGSLGKITEINKFGEVQNSFTTLSTGAVRCLSYDPLDGTIWYLDGQGNRAYQVDANGETLSSMVVDLGDNYCGGEIAGAATPGVPGPAAIVPFIVGGLGVWARRFKKRS